MKNINKSLLVVLCLIIALLVWLLSNSRERLSKYQNQISKYSNLEQDFNERILKDSSRLVEQEQIILSQKEAIDLGLLEIKRLKKIKSKVSTITITKIDTFYIPFKEVLHIHDTIYPIGTLKTPKRFELSNPFYGINGVVLTNGIVIDSLGIKNRMDITIGQKRNGIFKKSTPIVEVVNSNPYVQTLSMQNVIIEDKKRFYESKLFWFGAGVLGGVLILNN